MVHFHIFQLMVEGSTFVATKVNEAKELLLKPWFLYFLFFKRIFLKSKDFSYKSLKIRWKKLKDKLKCYDLKKYRYSNIQVRSLNEFLV